jgi:hypothetical protein
MKCLEKNPDRRFQTGREMAEALGGCTVCEDRTEVDSIPGPARKIPRSVYMAGVALLLLIALVAVRQYIKHQDVPGEMALLSIESDPADAEVFINGELKGRTPLKVELPLGKQEVRMQLQDYYNWEAQIDLDKAEETPIFVKLNPMVF